MGIFRFEKTYYALFDDVIYPLISTQTGLSCHDARSYYEAQTVKMDLITRLIDESVLIIIDISENNANVFLELGIAYALHKPIIILCNEAKYKKVWKKGVPFDMQGRDFVRYDNEIDLRVKIGRPVFDALYRTEPCVLSWMSRDPLVHVKSSSEIQFFGRGEVWSDRAVKNGFLLRYRVKIEKVLDDRHPDMRLFFSHEPDYPPGGKEKGFPRIAIIFPWEYSEKSPNKYECHIDYLPDAKPETWERLQQVAVAEEETAKINKGTPLEYDFSVSFSWPNLTIESSLFLRGKPRLVEALKAFQSKGYPAFMPQYIGFASTNSHALIQKVDVKQVFTGPRTLSN
jgi:hypothetical protein